MPFVTFEPSGASIEVESGTSLLDAAREAGVRIRNDCGGQGVCRRCVVRVDQGQVHSSGSTEDLAENETLACRTLVFESDVTVHVPESSREVREDVTISKGEPSPVSHDPEKSPVRRFDLSLSKPTLEDHLPDTERLVRALEAQEKANYSFAPGLLRVLPLRLRDADWEPRVTVARGPCGYEVLDVEARESSWPAVLAVDIGTTSLKASLIAPGPRWNASCYNSQIVYGPDVISRIIHTQRNDGGLKQLQRLVIGDINRLLTALLKKADVDRREVLSVVASGNTTMTHLLLGMEPAWIRREPYVGCSYRLPPMRAAELGLHIHPDGLLYCLPSVSSYVGGDITAGVIATKLYQAPAPRMLIDLGTNGEIVIGSQDFMVCCSASAGPAFEGESGASGSRAKPGAIESVQWHDGLQVNTIGGESPAGICGSGYIDLLAELAGHQIINRSGKLQPGASHRVLGNSVDQMAYMVVEADESATGNDIVLTQADIDNLVRAKGAIYAAASVLLSSLGMEWKDLDEIMLAGGFGDKINKENAVRIGLLPDIPREKIHFVGNTSLRGTTLVAGDADLFARSGSIARAMTYFELSTHPDYMDNFVASCFLPHTHADEFPSVDLERVAKHRV
ncbi:MAG: DUF4445 domain-containing protein [Planctomycetes bacterium]|nr:DUF4445 domain-containing protein [Planctomycetota bacterium]